MPVKIQTGTLEEERICKKHGKTLFSKPTSDKWFTCKKCTCEHVVRGRLKVRMAIIQYGGGKCQKCGYDKCIGALEFHHLNKDEKDFSIAVRSFNLEKLKKEADKCILLCSNCHRELHFNQKYGEKNRLQGFEDVA